MRSADRSALTTGRHHLPVCPVDPAHGRVLDWPTERWAFHCPHADHDGHGERLPTRAFFRTHEVETGVLATPAASTVDPGPRDALGGPGAALDPGHRLAPQPAVGSGGTTGSDDIQQPFGS